MRRRITTLMLAAMMILVILAPQPVSAEDDWGAWSSWQDKEISADSNRQVETRSVIASYNMDSWVYTDYSSPSLRGYWPHSTDNILRAHHTETWSKDMVDTARKYTAGTYYNPQNTCDGLIHDGTAYVRVDGKGYDHVPFFVTSSNKKTQYRYRERKSSPAAPSASSVSIRKAKVSCAKKAVYTGKAIRISIRITISGKTLKAGTDYSVSYKNNTKVGKATVIIKGKGRYTGKITRSFRICPKKTTLNTVKGGTKRIVVKWKTAGKNCSGYQIRYSTSPKFKNARTKTVRGKAKGSVTLNSLKAGKIYYVQVRIYKIVNNKKYCSAWSKVKTVRVKAEKAKKTTKKKTTKYVAITSKPVKVGNYYYRFKQFSDGGGIARSKYRNSGYVRILKDTGSTMFTNGKSIYAVESEWDSYGNYSKYYLVRYSASGKNRKVLKRLPLSEEDESLGDWRMGTIYGNNIYLTKARGSNFILYTYRYSIKRKTLVKIASKCAVASHINDNKGSSGKYILTDAYVETAGLVAWEKSLCSITSGGKFRKIKKLGDNVDASFVGKYLYYVKFDKSDFMDDPIKITAEVYRCSRNGKNAKKLGSFTTYSYDYGVAHAYDFTKKTCTLEMGDNEYIFNYRTGKATRK